MMQIGGKFKIHAPVSRSVTDNIIKFNRIWNVWCPDRYKLIQIDAEIIPDDYRPDNRKMITAFSGGLDASYTAYKYKKNLDAHFQYDLDAAVMVFGADIPLNAREQFNMAFATAKQMTDDLGIKLIPVETNYRDYPHDWEHEFGAVIIAILNFFAGHYGYGAASDSSVHHLSIPWGMNPITDWYMTNDTFHFIPDGYEHTRTQRAAFIKDWDVALKNLRVCWRNDDKSKNCGKCEKCVRTKLNFMAVGCEKFSAVPFDVTLNQVLKHNFINDDVHMALYQDIYNHMCKHNTGSDTWRKFLGMRIKQWERIIAQNNKKTRVKKPRKHHSIWWHIRHMKF